MGYFFIMMNQSSGRYTFPKAEHLCGEIRINQLFAEGKAFIVYPLRIVYSVRSSQAGSVPVQVMVSVPKKRFKRAVKRNRLKRLMREAYRLSKPDFVADLSSRGLSMQIAFNYVSDDQVDFVQMQRKMSIALQKITERLPQGIDVSAEP